MKYSNILEYKLKILEDKSECSLDEKIIKSMDDQSLSINEKLNLIEILKNEINGYGVIQPFLDDEDISEIMINGLESFYIEKNGEILKTEKIYESVEHIMQFVYRVGAEIGREINQAKPVMDGRLADGSRVNIILNPIAIDGPVITIRKFNKNILSSSSNKNFPEAVNSLMKLMVRCRFNIFISGGTSTGKTTLLNYIAQSIPVGERVITIEDAAEIDIKDQGHVIAMETRASTNKDSVIGISDLIKNSLRMRPDRIIVGEVRGEEVVDMLQAMNTGHQGSISTGHANSAMDMLTRLEVVATGHTKLDNLLIRRQIISAIDVIIHLEKIHERRVLEGIYEINKNKNDYELNKIFDFEKDAEATENQLTERIIDKRKLRRFQYQ